MTLLGAADEAAAPLDADADADGAKVLTVRPETSEAASLGETVVVLANELVEFVLESVELELDDEEELLPLPLLTPLPFLRMRLDITSTSMSMKVNSGPATIALLCRSMTPPFKG